MATVHKRSAVDELISPNEAKAQRNADYDALDTLDSTVRTKVDQLMEAGIIVEGDLDDKALTELASFNSKDGIAVLKQFESADLGNVRNKSAYLHGVMIRYRPVAGPRLDRDVTQRLERLFRTSSVKQFDGRVYEQLSELPPFAAVRAIDKFQAKVSDDVRNPSAFFTTMMRQEDFSGPAPSSRAHPHGGAYGPHGGYHDAPPPPIRDPHPYSYEQPMPYQQPPPPARMGGGPSHQQHQHPQTVVSTPTGPQVLVLNPETLQQLGGALSGPQGGGGSLQHLLPQILALLQQQQQQGPGGPPPIPAPVRPDYGAEQAQLGVRVAEFHGLSNVAPFVRPAPAIKLQDLWDRGNRLVSLLDDRSWEVLASLPAAEALTVIDAVAERVHELNNPNAFFVSCAKKYSDKARPVQHLSPHASQYSSQERAYTPPHHTAYVSTGHRGPGSQGGGQPYALRQQDPAQLRAGHGTGGGIDTLPDNLQQCAREAIARHHPLLTEDMFDEGVVGYLKKLADEEAEGVFDEMLTADLSSVRNMPAFLMGMIKKRRSAAMERRGPGGGGRY